MLHLRAGPRDRPSLRTVAYTRTHLSLPARSRYSVFLFLFLDFYEFVRGHADDYARGMISNGPEFSPFLSVSYLPSTAGPAAAEPPRGHGPCLRPPPPPGLPRATCSVLPGAHRTLSPKTTLVFSSPKTPQCRRGRRNLPRLGTPGPPRPASPALRPGDSPTSWPGAAQGLLCRVFPDAPHLTWHCQPDGEDKAVSSTSAFLAPSTGPGARRVGLGG